MASGDDTVHLGGDAGVAVEEAQLATLFQGDEVLCQIGRSGTLVGVTSVGPLQALDPVFGVGEGGHGLSLAQDGIAATVIRVKMGVDDDVNVLRSEVQAAQVLHQATLASDAPNLSLFGRQLIAEASIHQYPFALGDD